MISDKDNEDNFRFIHKTLSWLFLKYTSIRELKMFGINGNLGISMKSRQVILHIYIKITIKEKANCLKLYILSDVPVWCISYIRKKTQHIIILLRQYFFTSKKRLLLNQVFCCNINPWDTYSKINCFCQIFIYLNLVSLPVKEGLSQKNNVITIL